MIAALLLLAVTAETGAELLQKVASTYASCKSYRDRGVAVKEWLDPGRDHIRRYPFITAFVRPDRFRFEYGEKSRQHDRGEAVLWSAAGVSKWWLESSSEPSKVDLGQQLPFLSYRSAWTATTVPALLFELEKPAGDLIVPVTRLPILSEPVREVLEGHDVWCMELDQTDRGAAVTIRLWIDVARLLLLQVEREELGGEYPDRVVIRYQPEIDVVIADQELALTAPWGDTRIGTFGWLLRIASVGGIVLGITWYAVSRRSLELGRPIVVRTNWYISAGLLLASAHPLAEVFGAMGGLEDFADWSMRDNVYTIFAVALPLLSLYFHMRKHGGYTVVGANQIVLSRALVAALQVRGLEYMGGVQTVKLRGRGGEFLLGGSPTRPISTIKMKDATDDSILREVLPSLVACFGSDLVPFDSAACRRRMIYGIAVALISFVVAVWIWGETIDL